MTRLARHSARRPPLAELRKLYGYPDWGGRNRLESHLLLWQWRVRGTELPGWRLLRARDMKVPQGPRTMQAIWRRQEGGDEELVRFDIFECDSRTQAHSHLVRLLAESEQPAATITETEEAGDIAFVVAARTFMVFARANLLLLVRNAGRAVVPVQDIGARFDRQLVDKPEAAARTAAGPAVPAIRLVPLMEEARRGVVPLAIEADAEPTSYRFESASGEVFLRDRRLMYKQTSPGPQEVTAYGITEQGNVARVARRFEELTTQDRLSRGATRAEAGENESEKSEPEGEGGQE